MNKNYEENYDRLKLIGEMENEFNNRNTEFFNKLAFHHDPVIRTRSICIIAEIGGNEAVNIISKVLKEDVDELVRHEAAFSLGQLGFKSGIKALPNIRFRLVSCAPNIRIGKAEITNATGLNQPGITFLSSI